MAFDHKSNMLIADTNNSYLRKLSVDDMAGTITYFNRSKALLNNYRFSCQLNDFLIQRL